MSTSDSCGDEAQLVAVSSARSATVAANLPYRACLLIVSKLRHETGLLASRRLRTSLRGQVIHAGETCQENSRGEVVLGQAGNS